MSCSHDYVRAAETLGEFRYGGLASSATGCLASSATMLVATKLRGLIAAPSRCVKLKVHDGKLP